VTVDPGLAASAPERLVSWIEAETGLRFPEVHHETIRRVARARSAKLGLEADAYEELIRYDAAEKEGFFNEIMIGETYFFRDEKHFAILISDILPGLIGEGRELRLWSATCATGEEAISLVAAVEHVKARLGAQVGYSVLASDINRDALARLEAGHYPPSSFRNDGKSLHGLLDRCGAMEGLEWQASADCLSRIRIRPLNILSGDLCEPDSLDIVFLRNTLVYMQQERKDRVVSRVARTIRPDGYLFLASPEIPSVRHPLLEIVEGVGGFYFRRLPVGSARAKVSATAAAPSLPATPPEREPGRTGPEPGRTESSLSSSIRAADLEKGLELASSWARNPRARGESAESPPGTEAALMIEAIVAAIHANRFDDADELLAAFETRARESHVSQYLRALSRKHQGHQTEALELWERARTYEPRFWPALFQAGFGYGKADPERGLALLRECLEAMDGEEGDGRYFILLEGFDAPYYRRMAERMLARAKKR
jgi:chemotaxis protein methyltransferase CheR